MNSAISRNRSRTQHVEIRGCSCLPRAPKTARRPLLPARSLLTVPFSARKRLSGELWLAKSRPTGEQWIRLGYSAGADCGGGAWSPLITLVPARRASMRDELPTDDGEGPLPSRCSTTRPQAISAPQLPCGALSSKPLHEGDGHPDKGRWHQTKKLRVPSITPT